MACNLLVVSGMAFEARAARGPGVYTLHGLNPDKLVSDMERMIGQGVGGIVSFGTCAGLAPALAPGAVVVGRSVLYEGNIWQADAAWAAQLMTELPNAIGADIAGVAQPLTSVQEKAQLYAATSAMAADMESQHVARIAQKYALPFAVVRVVLDDASCALPPAALVATKADGTINYGKLLASLLAQPWQIPSMIALGGKHSAAKQSLLRCGKLLHGSFIGVHFGG